MSTRRSVLPAAALAAALLAGCGGAAEDTTGAAPAASASPSGSASAAANDADVMFARMMVPHHEEAVRMAGLAATRAERAEVKRLAARIAAGQAPEAETLRGWLAAWGAGDEDHADMGHEMPGDMSDADLRSLEGATGTAFEKQFLGMMVAHHEGAVAMAREQLAEGSHPDAKALARQIADTQQAEIAELKGLLAES